MNGNHGAVHKSLEILEERILIFLHKPFCRVYHIAFIRKEKNNKMESQRGQKCPKNDREEDKRSLKYKHY